MDCLELRSLRPEKYGEIWEIWRNPISTKYGEIPSLQKTQKLAVWWHLPVIPATWEAEARESLEPRRQRLW